MTPTRSAGRHIRLPQPSILFADNHLLVVHKPPGWASIPTHHYNNNNNSNSSNDDDHQKSLLHHLQERRLGGGSQQTFLVPLHRIDQPCSGLLMLAKTSKAASRVTKVWKKGLVHKTYLCAINGDDGASGDGLERLQAVSTETSMSMSVDSNDNNDNMNTESSPEDTWYHLEGWMVRNKAHKSVVMLSRPPGHHEQSSGHNSNDTTSTLRHCSLHWRPLSDTVIEVSTAQGARHMIRAMLSAVGGTPLRGDLRYGAERPLPDQSVALHAQTVTLPSTLVLGRTDGPAQPRKFVAPIPGTWIKWGIYTHRG